MNSKFFNLHSKFEIPNSLHDDLLIPDVPRITPGFGVFL